MAKRSFCSIVSYKELVKHIHSTPKVSSNKFRFFSNANANANVHTRGDDPFVGAVKATTEVADSVGETVKESVHTAWDAAKETAELITETTTAEADTNVVDTAEYRSAEDLKGQLGDGYDNL